MGCDQISAAEPIFNQTQIRSVLTTLHQTRVIYAKKCCSFDNHFFASGVGFPLYLEIFYIITQGSCIASGSLWGDARFEPGTSAPEVWCPTNDPPHHRDVAKKCVPLSLLFWPFNCHQLVSLCLSVNDDIVSPHLSCGLTKPGKLSTTFCKAMRRLE